MKQWPKFLLLLLIGVSATRTAYSRLSAVTPGDTLVTFRFLPGEDRFFLQGNETELNRLYTLIDTYRTEITSGKMPVYVDGYCTSLPMAKENLNTAFIRANRVKSELITQKGLKEEVFITTNYARAYHNNKDVVVITLRIPAKEEPEAPAVSVESVVPEKQERQPESTVEKEVRPTAEKPESVTEALPKPAISAKPYDVALRTNLLYDAFLLPTIGLEWRVNSSIGIKVDGSFSRWGGKQEKVQKAWLLNPEIRWYIGSQKRFYAGASGNYGEYNIYKYPMGNLLSKDTGYQGHIWNAGLTAGYQLLLSRIISLDFNLGLGYTCSEYDSFELTNGRRTYKERSKTKKIWGPTQAGISLVWTIGRNR